MSSFISRRQTEERITSLCSAGEDNDGVRLRDLRALMMFLNDYKLGIDVFVQPDGTWKDLSTLCKTFHEESWKKNTFLKSVGAVIVAALALITYQQVADGIDLTSIYNKINMSHALGAGAAGLLAINLFENRQKMGGFFALFEKTVDGLMQMENEFFRDENLIAESQVFLQTIFTHDVCKESTDIKAAITRLRRFKGTPEIYFVKPNGTPRKTLIEVCKAVALYRNVMGNCGNSSWRMFRGCKSRPHQLLEKFKKKSTTK